LAGDALPQPGTAGDLWSRIYQLTDVLGATAALTILTFAAYLLGSVASTANALSGLVRLNSFLSIRSPWYRKVIEKQESRSVIRVTSERNIGTFVESEMRRIARLSGGVWVDDLAEALGMPIEGVYGTFIPSTFIWSLTSYVTFQDRTLAVRLQIASENLYQSYDRKKAEADFRSAMSVPLIVLCFVLAIVDDQPAWLLLLPLPVALILQGRRRGIEAKAELLQVLTQRVIKSPFLENLDEVAARRHKARTVRAHEEGNEGYELPPDRIMLYPDGTVAPGASWDARE